MVTRQFFRIFLKHGSYRQYFWGLPRVTYGLNGELFSDNKSLIFKLKMCV